MRKVLSFSTPSGTILVSSTSPLPYSVSETTHAQSAGSSLTYITSYVISPDGLGDHIHRTMECGSREPVCAGDVKTDRYRNRFGAQTGTAPDHAQQAERCNEFTKKLPATGAHVI